MLGISSPAARERCMTSQKTAAEETIRKHACGTAGGKTDHK